MPPKTADDKRNILDKDRMMKSVCKNKKTVYPARRSPALLRVSPFLGTFFKREKKKLWRPENAHKIPARSCHMLRKKKENTELAAVSCIMFPNPNKTCTRYAKTRSDDKGKDVSTNIMYHDRKGNMR